MNSAEFIGALRTEFPELAPLLDDDEGLFCLQVGSLATHTQAAIDDGDRATLKQLFEMSAKRKPPETMKCETRLALDCPRL